LFFVGVRLNRKTIKKCRLFYRGFVLTENVPNLTLFDMLSTIIYNNVYNKKNAKNYSDSLFNHFYLFKK